MYIKVHVQMVHAHVSTCTYTDNQQINNYKHKQ